MMTITKSTNGRYMLEYDAPEGSHISGYRCSCGDIYEAVDRAIELTRLIGKECVIEIKDSK